MTHTVWTWANILNVNPYDYQRAAQRLGYPVYNVTDVVPKHHHDDIKKEFRR